MERRFLDVGIEAGPRFRELEVGGEAGEGGPNIHGSARPHRIRPGAAHGVVPPRPLDRQRVVAHIREVEDIAPRIAGEAQAVAPLRPRLEGSLQVRQVIGKLEPRPDQDVEVGAAAGHAPPRVGEAHLVRKALREGPVHGNPRRQQADSGVHADIPVPHIRLHREDRRHAAPVLGREAARLQFGALHHVGVEDREDPAQVKGVEDGDVVQEDQVLVRRSTPHIEGRGEVGDRGHARQHLHRPYRVGLHQDRERLHLDAADLLDRRARRLLETGTGAAALRLDRDPFQGDRLRHQADVEFERGPGRDFDPPLIGGVPDPGHREDVGAGRHVGEGEEPEAVRVGYAPPGGIGGGDEADAGRAEEEAVGGPDTAADRAVLGRGGGGKREGEEGGGESERQRTPQHPPGDLAVSTPNNSGPAPPGKWRANGFGRRLVGHVGEPFTTGCLNCNWVGTLGGIAVPPSSSPI